jgi:hypothetical protein
MKSSQGWKDEGLDPGWKQSISTHDLIAVALSNVGKFQQRSDSLRDATASKNHACNIGSGITEGMPLAGNDDVPIAGTGGDFLLTYEESHIPLEDLIPFLAYRVYVQDGSAARLD